MTLRTMRDRILQTIIYEAGGLLLVTPLYASLFNGAMGESALLILALSVMVMIWAPIHNTLADWIELRFADRLSSARPHHWRICHALSLEITAALLTVPVLMWVGELSFGAALLTDIGLTLFYSAYAYVFHLIYDRLRPVIPAVTERAAPPAPR